MNYATEAKFENGIMRWISNDRVPFDDEITKAITQGFPADLKLCAAARDAQNAAFIAEYKIARANRSPEQIAEEAAEARAAHGSGVTLVNVLTGEKFTT